MKETHVIDPEVVLAIVRSGVRDLFAITQQYLWQKRPPLELAYEPIHWQNKVRAVLQTLQAEGKVLFTRRGTKLTRGWVALNPARGSEIHRVQCPHCLGAGFVWAEGGLLKKPPK